MPNIVTSPRTILLRRLVEMGMSEEEFIKELEVRLIKEGEESDFAFFIAFDTEVVGENKAHHYEAITGIPANLWIEQSKRYDKYGLDLLDEAMKRDPLFMDKTLNPERYE